MVFPYYSRPEDDAQEPEEEQQPEETQSWLPSYIYAYVNPKPPPPPPPLDPAIEEYNQRQEARVVYKPDKKVTVAQPAGSSGGAEPTAAPRRPSYLDDVEAYEQRAEQRAAAQLEVLQDISQNGQFQPDTLLEPEEPIWHESTPLTLGQAQHVEHLLDVETNVLAREVLFTLQRDGMPPRSQWNDFMAPYALWSWDAQSDAQALATLSAIAQSDWDEIFAYADADYVETVAQDQGDDLIEGLVIINARTGDILLDRTGVVRADGSQYVGLQDTELEALRELGLELIFIHNHPNGTEASAEDLDSAFRAGAELLIVITPQGQEFVYIRGRYGMVKVRDEKSSYKVGPATLRETRELVARSKAQERAFKDDSPELVFLQDEPGFTKRLANAAEELNLDTELPVSELIEQLLHKATADERAFGLAALAYYGYGDSNAVGPAADLKELLERTLPYRKTAEVTGVDPGLLAQLVLWETPHWSRFWENADYGAMYNLGVKSFGIAQIKVDTATDMLNLYLDKFADLGSVLSDMEDDNQSWDEYKVGWALYSNEEFSIRAAGVYLAHIGDRIDADMDDKYHVQITDAQTEDTRSITWHQRQMLTAIGYNQGLNQAIARLAIRYTDGVESAIRDAISQGFVPDVLPPDGLQSELEAELKKRGVTVSNEKTDKAHIRPFELELLTRVANVQGLDQLLDDVDRAGAVNVVAGVQNILSVNDYDDNVLGRKQDAVDLYSLSYEGDRDES